MTADGSTVFFTAHDQLLGADTDTSADLYAAAVDAGGTVASSRSSPPEGRRLQPGRQLGRRRTGTRPARRRPAARSRSAAAAGSPPATARLLPQPGAARRRRGTANQPNLYSSAAAAAPQFVATARARRPARARRRRTTPRPARDRRLPGDPRRPLRGLPAVSTALTGVDNSASAGLPLRRRGDSLDCVSCDPSARPTAASPATRLLAPTASA